MKKDDQLYGPNVEGETSFSTWLSNQGRKKPEVQFVEYGARFEGRHFGYGYLIKANQGILDDQKKSKIAFHCCSPFGLYHQKGKVNIVSSMWESRDLHLTAVEKFRSVDVVLTPSKWCTKVFKDKMDCPVHTLSLWVDPSVWKFKERKLPEKGKKFRWLWLASADPRKGWPIVGTMWQKFFADNPDVELYMKTSSDNGKNFNIVEHGNTIIDRRGLTREALVELYHSAHGFIYPSGGEGFGWTCAEAISTGLPVVGTSVTGHKDFFDERFGYVVPTRDIVLPCPEMTTGGYVGYHMHVPSSESMGERMIQVMNSYDKALKRARAGSKNIQQNFTFEKYVNGLYSIVEKYS